MTYQAIVDRLRERTEMPLFAVSVWDAALQEQIAAALPETLWPGVALADAPAAAGVVAGLRLWNDDFTGAHNLAQGISTATGSYWHGLCHRREGHRGEGVASNLNNARHWFRRTGDHPAFDLVYRSALSVLDTGGSGFRWVRDGGPPPRRPPLGPVRHDRLVRRSRRPDAFDPVAAHPGRDPVAGNGPSRGLVCPASTWLRLGNCKYQIANIKLQIEEPRRRGRTAS